MGRITDMSGEAYYNKDFGTYLNKNFSLSETLSVAQDLCRDLYNINNCF